MTDETDDLTDLERPDPSAEPALERSLNVSGEPAAEPRRRPSSLRDALDDRDPDVVRRPLSPPALLHTASTERDSVGESIASASSDALDESLPQRFAALKQERPEVVMGIAFLGGLLLATILKRLGRR